ncbi:MAG TPA: glycosyltransferase family 9 protein, partial [Elusimicrobiales bacterium]|nr:glycosyltransferase family 9 protein [Elusimicrobiales bacterium]
MNATSKILVIQLRRIGDALLATPAVRLLKRVYPSATVDFLAEPQAADALAGNPHINEVILYDKKHPLKALWNIRNRGYDIVIDYMGNPRSGLITFLSGAPVKAGPGNVFWTCAYNKIMSLGEPPVYSSAEKIRMLEHIGIKNTGVSPLPAIYFLPEHKAWAEGILKTLGLSKEAP